MIWLATLTLTLVPQGVVHGRPNRIKLPDPNRVRVQQTKPQARSQSERVAETFHRRVHELRRSLHLGRSEELARIRRLIDEFDDVAKHAEQLLRTAEPDVAYGALRALEMYGNVDTAKELKFLLLTRSFGKVTKVAVDTMVGLAQAQAKDYLFECLTASRDAVRRYASERLDEFLVDADAPRLISLSRQGSTDVQIKTLRLLGVTRTEAATRRLIESLGQKPIFAEAGCRGLVRQGEAAVEALREVLVRPALNLSYGYASFALAEIQEDLGRVLFTAEMLPHLLAELDTPHAFQRAAVALALAKISWESDDTTGLRYRDGEVVDNMLAVVAPVGFVQHFAMLKDPLLRELTRFTGKTFGLRYRQWRQWWEQVGKTTYVGVRRRVVVTPDLAPVAILTWAGVNRRLRVRGPKALTPKPADDTLDYVLAPDEILELIAELETAGFMGPSRRYAGSDDPRWLRLEAAGARCQSEAELSPRILDRFHATVRDRLEPERWQLYRDPDAVPDPVEFWRSETEWRQRHPDSREHADRLKSQIVTLLGTLAADRLDLAMQHLAEIEDLQSLLTEADGISIANAAVAHRTWDERSFRVMALALRAPGDAAWRILIQAAEARYYEGGRDALAQLFALSGHERLLESILVGGTRSRIAAMDEVAKLRDLRAVPHLLRVLTEESVELQQSAAYSLGRIGAAEARAPMLNLLTTEGDVMPALLRQTIWVALGRIGGDEVLPVLQAASHFPDPEDRMAVLRALGALAHPAAARELATIFGLRGSDALGSLALSELKKKGDLAASPALATLLDHSSVEVKRQAALALGEFQNAAALPELMKMLGSEADELRVVALIAGITGVDLTPINGRLEHIRDWYVRNRGLSQAIWYLKALREYGVTTSLDATQLSELAGLVAVPELTRLLVGLQQSHLRVLTGRILRKVTNRDFGVIGPFDNEARLRSVADRYGVLVNPGKAANDKK